MRAAAYMGTRNLYPMMLPAIKSLIANSAVEKVYLLIEDEEFPVTLPKMVKTIDVSGQEWIKEDSPNYDCYWTHMPLLKPALCHILPKTLKSVLVLDVDTVVLRDCSSIWDMDMSGCYFAGVVEPLKTTEELPYFNAGVTYQNLTLMRKGMADEVLEVLNSEKVAFPEQDTMNRLCKGHIKELDGRWNATDFTAWSYDPIIRHYAAKPDWHLEDDVLAYRHMAWDEVMTRHEKVVEKHA